MNLQKKQIRFAKNVAYLIAYIFDNDCFPTFGECWRSPEQAAIYAKEGKGIVSSLHCKRLAIDLNLFNSDGLYLTKKSDYKQFGMYWESLDPANRWGGNFKKLVDSGHFEMQDL